MVGRKYGEEDNVTVSVHGFSSLEKTYTPTDEVALANAPTDALNWLSLLALTSATRARCTVNVIGTPDGMVTELPSQSVGKPGVTGAALSNLREPSKLFSRTSVNAAFASTSFKVPPAAG